MIYPGPLAINVGTDGDAIILQNFDPSEIDGSLVVRTLQFDDGKQLNLADFLNNNPPIAYSIDGQTATQDVEFSFTVPEGTFSDPDAGDALTYSVKLDTGDSLPDWLRFDLDTMTFTGTPTNDDVDVLSIDVTATDNYGGRATSNFSLTVENVNDAPIVSYPIGDQSVLEDDEGFSFTVPPDTFADIDADDSLIFTATLDDGEVVSELPYWLSFDGSTFSGTPTNDDVGTYSIMVTATDTSGETASTGFNLEVINVNDAPEVQNPIDNQTTMEDASYSFVVPTDTFKDVDVGDVLTYSVTGLPEGLTFDEATMTISGIPVGIGVYAITVTATDTSGASVDCPFNLDVQINVVEGDDYANTLYGTAHANIMYGFGGNDTLYGYTGNDTLDGGTGTDKLVGGSGDDTYIIVLSMM
jgi:Ca2+-binding RTX toxin-like protein